MTIDRSGLPLNQLQDFRRSKHAQSSKKSWRTLPIPEWFSLADSAKLLPWRELSCRAFPFRLSHTHRAIRNKRLPVWMRGKQSELKQDRFIQSTLVNGNVECIPTPVWGQHDFWAVPLGSYLRLHFRNHPFKQLI